MDVISLDEGKVIMKENMVLKHSNFQEVEALKKAYEKSKNLKNVVVPEIYDFRDDIIYMQRCYGDNLELLLRNAKTHSEGVKHVNYLLNYLLSNGFYWCDFAPRNILFNNGKYMIFDFERGLAENVVDWRLYFINNVYEEYGAFLLPEERLFTIDDIFNVNDLTLIDVESISSKRVKKILKMFGFTNKVPLFVYVFTVKMIVINEEPYINNGEIVFPLLELEDFVKNYGRDKYAEKIVGGYYARIRSL